MKRDPSKNLQLGFLTLLVLSMLLVAYWIADNYRYTQAVQRDLIALMAGESSIRSDDGEPVSLDEALAELEAATASRINRYLWEGAFFLAVLIGGMAILTRTIRHDAELRQRQQNFLAAVSHEFKSPLASMQLAAETLKLRATEADSQRQGQRILEDCERLLRMVDNLLDTTRLEEGRLAQAPERVVLADIAASVVEANTERMTRHGIAAEVDVASDLALELDRTSIYTILSNLVDNAIKACAAGNGHLIRVHARVDNGTVVLAVTDDGQGFPPEDAEMMFEKFYRSGDELRRTTPGTGLGLYIVKRLVELSGGDVTAFSDGIGHGATVSVRWSKTT